MKVVTTPHELLEKGLWEKYCKETGTNIYSVTEGLFDSYEEIKLTNRLMEKLGLDVIIYTD